jgi:hypothetical protein
MHNGPVAATGFMDHNDPLDLTIPKVRLKLVGVDDGINSVRASAPIAPHQTVHVVHDRRPLEWVWLTRIGHQTAPSTRQLCRGPSSLRGKRLSPVVRLSASFGVSGSNESESLAGKSFQGKIYGLGRTARHQP